MALSVRSSFVTGSQKKAKPGEKQTPDPKTGHQSQLKQLEARMKEQLKQIQHQVTCECHPVPTNLLIMAVSLGALASECPQTRAKQLTEINFGSADVGVGYGSTSAGQKQKREDRHWADELVQERGLSASQLAELTKSFDAERARYEAEAEALRDDAAQPPGSAAADP